MIVFQDRLGTNTRKLTKKAVFSQIIGFWTVFSKATSELFQTCYGGVIQRSFSWCGAT